MKIVYFSYDDTYCGKMIILPRMTNEHKEHIKIAIPIQCFFFRCICKFHKTHLIALIKICRKK